MAQTIFSIVDPSLVACHDTDAAAGIRRCSKKKRGSKEQARSLLRALRDSRNELNAEAAIQAIHRRVTPGGHSEEDEEVERAFCKLLLRCNGIPIIIAALSKWVESVEFASLATIVLMNMTHYESKCGQCIADLGGIRLLVKTAERLEDLDLTADTLIVLTNIADSEDFDLKEDVATEGCISFVLDQMNEYVDDDIIQRNACNYLQNICCVPTIRHYVAERGVPKALSRAAETFRDKDSTVVELAKNALNLLYGID